MRLFIFFSFLFVSSLLLAQTNPLDLVNPLIGTGGHGHTFPGATVPFGMVQLSPDTRLEGWDGCGGYHYDDDFIYGFSHTHLSGTGVPDLCDILLMPIAGKPNFPDGEKRAFGSHFSHQAERASPGYYEVVLSDYQIKARFTATARTGMHQYQYPADRDRVVLLDLGHRDEVTGVTLKVVDDHTLAGCRKSTGWANKQQVYFVIEFSEPFVHAQVALDDTLLKGAEFGFARGKLQALLDFGKGKDALQVKVGISAVGIDGARRNLKAEIPGWDFETVKTQAEQLWAHELGKIEIQGGGKDKRTVFYTALYHCMVCPNLYMDVDSNYLGRDFQIHKASGFNNYTVFSLWDTYRAWNPLITLLDPMRTRDFVKTFLAQYTQGGRLPVWELQANETDCMIGYHSVPVIVDAWMKGIQGFDAELALKAMINSALPQKSNSGLEALDSKGFIESDDESESVSKTLEYAYDDWCIAIFARQLGHEEIYRQFIRRAQAYKNLFDNQSGFFRARYNGGWYSPFDPYEVNNNYTEANAWQYSFSAVQDLSGFMKMIGGPDSLDARLDRLFQASAHTTGREQSDITGLIGQYVHGNEPSHHIAYLYPFAGKAWKTQRMVHKIMEEMYHNAPDGLAGNEDCGQMSAWAVMSALGIYAVTPGTDQYVFGTPWFDKAIIHLGQGKEFVIESPGAANGQYFIQSASLNNRPYAKAYIGHQQIVAGGGLAFKMGFQPNKQYGSGEADIPVTSIPDYPITPAPVVDSPAKSFRDTKKVGIISQDNSPIYYSIIGDESPKGYQAYNQPFTIQKSTEVHFYAEKEGVKSSTITSKFVQMANNMTATLVYPPAHQYSSGGADNLIDNIFCGTDFRTGGWLGFEGNDLKALVELKDPRPVQSVAIHCLQDINAWIFYPTLVQVSVSMDGKSYHSVGSCQNTVGTDQDGAMLKSFEVQFQPEKVKFVKIVARNIATCPPGHKGNGGAAWLFSDEITIK